MFFWSFIDGYKWTDGFAVGARQFPLGIKTKSANQRKFKDEYHILYILIMIKIKFIKLHKLPSKKIHNIKNQLKAWKAFEVLMN